MKFLNKKLSVPVALMIAAASQLSIAQTSETEDCICEGKLTTLTLRYLGEESKSLTVMQKDGTVIWAEVVDTNDDIVLLGTYTGGRKAKETSKETLGPSIDLYLSSENSYTNLNIHTSCSIEINVGDEIGDFRVEGGTSRVNGAICNSEPPCDPDGEEGCDDTTDG